MDGDRSDCEIIRKGRGLRRINDWRRLAYVIREKSVANNTKKKKKVFFSFPETNFLW